MIVHEAPQGTEEWFADRLGIPSASMADKILSPTGKPSTSAGKYANQLLAERLTGRSGGFAGNAHTERGNELEPEARGYYAFISGCEVKEVGFCTNEEGTFGCSPDGLVGTDGMLEIKVPSPAVHVGYLLGNKLPTTYISQVQTQLWVTDRKWLDLLSYSDAMESLVVRVLPDKDWHKAWAVELAKFTEQMAAKWKTLQERT
jgi:hypothetical protein